MSEGIPRIVKHVTMALLREKAARTFIDALGMARRQLVRYGYLRSGSEAGPVSAIRMTAAGHQRNRQHLRESVRKSMEFDRLFARYGKELDEGRPDKDEDPRDASEDR